MRIISGMAGGIHLETPTGMDVRPTEDRVKESIFSTLGDLTGKTVLDLFAGTGALGLEALSRGASVVHGFEINRRNSEVIKRNIALVEKQMAIANGYILHVEDAQNASTILSSLAGRIDVILADPPYETAQGQYGWRELMLDDGMAQLMAPDGILMLEHGSAKELPWTPESQWKCLRSKVFGIRCVSYASLANRRS